MCNIAGYVGDRDAAPILIEMMKKEEGWGGGYYSGLATIHEGKLYYAKLTGDMDRLLALTDAAKLPGHIGIIHSRSRSGGGDEWAHPFVDVHERMAYVANGSYGIFADRADERTAAAVSLDREGYTLRSRQPGAVGRYPRFPDGSAAHMSDVMASLIARYIDRGRRPADSMSDAFCSMPSEIVGLVISLTMPEAIAFSRVNQPMNLAFASHGAYLATTELAFPDDAGEARLLPANSSGVVTYKTVNIQPYEAPPCKVAAIDARVYGEAWELALAALKEKPLSVGEVCRAILPAFGEGDCTPSAALAYAILTALYKAGRMEIQTSVVEGVNGLPAPHLKAALK